MSDLIYEASVYTRTVKYRNFKGEENTVVLSFALDPLKLMSIIAGFGSKRKTIKSGNPAKNGQEAPFTDEQQLSFVRDLASQAAGSPSEDGESWVPFEDFTDTIAGKAFLTKLASSDGDRREFAQTVILNPFRAFVEFAKADPSNTAADIQQFETMLGQIEKIFTVPDPTSETVDQKRARLEAEMEMLNQAAVAEPNVVPPAEA